MQLKDFTQKKPLFMRLKMILSGTLCVEQSISDLNTMLRVAVVGSEYVSKTRRGGKLLWLGFVIKKDNLQLLAL